jgi:hypothetical protein
MCRTIFGIAIMALMLALGVASVPSDFIRALPGRVVIAGWLERMAAQYSKRALVLLSIAWTVFFLAYLYLALIWGWNANLIVGAIFTGFSAVKDCALLVAKQSSNG